MHNSSCLKWCPGSEQEYRQRKGKHRNITTKRCSSTDLMFLFITVSPGKEGKRTPRCGAGFKRQEAGSKSGRGKYSWDPEAHKESFSLLLGLSHAENLSSQLRAAWWGLVTDSTGMPIDFSIYRSAGFFARVYKHLPNRNAYKKEVWKEFVLNREAVLTSLGGMCHCPLLRDGQLNAWGGWEK